jgi:hypothetical protein
MIPYLGDFVEDDTVYLMFNTFSSDDPSASITITNLANTDVHIHKDDNTTQRNNAAGITVSVNFDTITGSHMIKIDTNDNTVAGFWVTGHDYFVRIEGTTIDGATINAVVGHFSIQNRYTRGTDSANTTTPPTVTAIREEMDTNSTKMAPSQTLNDYKATGFSTHNAAAVKTAIEAAGSSIAQILADTNELELDWKDGGRLDLIIDIIAADTTTDIPGLILKYTQLLARSDAAIATDNATELTAINADGGSGAGDFSNQTDAAEALRDRGDAAWTTGAGGSAPTVGEIRAEMEGNGYFLDLIKADTNELQTDWANDGRLDLLLDACNTTTPPTVAAIRQEMDTNSTKMAPSQTLNDYKATGFSTHSAADVKTDIEAAGSSIAQILADTGELQTDWVNGGRLDLILDIIAADTTTDIPTLIAALNDITVADIIAGISDGTLDLQEMMRIILSATAGKSSGGGTVTLVFRDAADSKARITATVDTNGNRTAMTLDGA